MFGKNKPDASVGLKLQLLMNVGVMHSCEGNKQCYTYLVSGEKWIEVLIITPICGLTPLNGVRDNFVDNYVNR